MLSEVTIVDYGVGNIASIINMLAKSGISGKLSKDPEDILKARRVILPGVGSFDKAAVKLKENHLDEVVKQVATNGTPLLGVCLGMQLLLESSEEGSESGLGLIKGKVLRFPTKVSDQELNIPHMGWNKVKPQKVSKYIPSLGNGDRYYFVHSYYAAPDNAEDILGVTKYGVEFASAVEKDNVIGAQFHPEKSHRYGLRLLSEFCSTR